ncbi:MAG: hypothetical protein IJD35_06065 [Clostridia bacterium]|nr:hypothetical protein [Clostridia bacterium]
MKKVLLAFMAILLVASMFALMASCGKSTATTNENTSGTSALTTGAVPDNKLPDNTDYSKKAGSRFEFVISAEGYFATDYNAQGNPLVRRIYEFETMVLPSDHVFFAYEYDAKGVLKGYSFRNYHFTEAQALTMTYDENGRAVSGEVSANGGTVSASWEYDKNGLIVSETLNMNGTAMTFTYDAQGRLVKESVDYGEGYIGECINTYGEGGVHQVATMGDETVVDADYTFNASGYPLTVKGNIGGADVDISYTYNEKNLCISSYSKSEDGSYKVETVYNDKDLAVSETTSTYDNSGVLFHKYVKEYTYDNSGRVLSQIRSDYGNDNKLRSKEIYSYEYDAAGNKIKEEREDIGPDGKTSSKRIETWSYNDKKQLLETTSTSYNRYGVIDEKESVSYEYDSKGNCVKETLKTYTPEGEVSKIRVQEFTYNEKNLCVKIEEKHHQGEAFVHHEVREYNENGQVTKKTDYHVDKEASSESGRTEEIYSYDEKGFVSKNDRTEYGADGKMTGRFVNEFKDGMPVKFTEYDADGNVVHSEDYSGNMGNNGSTKPIPPQENGNANNKEDNNSTAPETEKKPVDTHPEEKPEEYLPGIDYNGDGVIDENDMPGGSSSDSNGNAPENDIPKDETADHNGKAPENGAIGDTAVNGSITESVVKPAPNMGMVEDGYKYNDFINTKD